MNQKKLIQILACCSIAGLMTAAVMTTGCSSQEEKADKGEMEGLESSSQHSESMKDDSEKSKKPDGTEVQIRGKSG